MADLARKQLMITNPKKRKKTRGKKRRARARRHRNPGSHRKVRARRHRGSTSPRRSRRSSGRRKNPSLGHAALSTGAALAIGGVAALGAQVAAHLLGEAAATAEEPKPRLATALRIGTPALLAAGGGLGLSMVNPTVGKAVAAGAGAVSLLQVTSAIAAKMGAKEDGSANLLQKGGLQLLAGDEFNIRGNQVVRRMADGREVPMFSAQPRAYARLRDANGNVERYGVMGNIGQRGAVVVSPTGKMHILEGYQFDELSGYQEDHLQ